MKRFRVSLLVLATAACGPAATGAPDHLLIVIVVDTLRQDAVSCYGGEQQTTPRIDALAADGVRFDQAIASSGWTLPSMASLLTGTSPPVHKALGKVSRLTPISPDVRTGAEILEENGFRTIAFTNAAFVNPLLGLTRGFEIVSHHHAYNDELRRADATIAEAFAAIRDHGGRNTLALIHLFDPHLNYDPPDGFEELYRDGVSGPPPPFSREDCVAISAGFERGLDPAERHALRAAYDAEVNAVDHHIGRLVDELDDLGLLERATIVITSDHGEEFWEHAGFDHGHTLYDELVHVPLVVRFAEGIAPRGLAIRSQVRLIDVLPTLFELVGLPPSEDFEGTSLLPLVRGESEEPRVALSYGTLYGGRRNAAALRDERYKFISDPNRDDSEELYDWREDPGETRNLIEKQSEVAERMRSTLAESLRDLETRAATNRRGEVQLLAPERMDEYMDRLRSLGYLGDDAD